MAKAAQPVTAQSIFNYAEAYAEAAETLVTQLKRLSPFKDTQIPDAADLAPSAVLDALALELYLKCLHFMDHGKASRGHEPVKLFAALKPGTQKAIRTLYNDALKTYALAPELANRHPKFQQGLDNVLDWSNDIFINVRYLYEGNNSKMFYWPLTRIVVRNVILATHPNWKKFG